MAYVGRFAPSPTGDLHLGSLYTAAAGYLDAKATGGRWLIRMEDLDTPRVVPGSAARILNALHRFGFEWHDEVVSQSERTDHYLAALRELHERGLTFACSCSRAQRADDDRYPGTCRAGPSASCAATATRVRVDSGQILFTDRVQGMFRQDVATAVGDIIVRRRDQLFAYVLAVVVDDAAQGITHVVRGSDLLDNTPRQIYLQRLLGLPELHYAHVPVLTEPDGRKLAKSSRSVALDSAPVAPQLMDTFALLGLSPPSSLRDASISDMWHWAVHEWDVSRVPRRLSLPLNP